MRWLADVERQLGPKPGFCRTLERGNQVAVQTSADKIWISQSSHTLSCSAFSAAGTKNVPGNFHRPLPYARRPQIYSQVSGNRQAEMRRAINHLEQLADDRLFIELSEGMPLIVDNAVSLEKTACRLFEDGEFRASEVMRGIAEEEAAKFLILMDYVRCPRHSEHRAQVLKRFYGHVTKRVHAMACSYERIASFGELSKLVEDECRPLYLDGPNGIDWVFPNSIAAEREQGLYVDYVQDITDPSGDRFWTTPPAPSPWSSQYATPDSVGLCQALLQVGAASAAGLAEIADIWRGFVPEPDTDREQLRKLILHTLERLSDGGHAADELAVEFIVLHWPFPMWLLEMKEPRLPDGDLEQRLREVRQRQIEWIEETESKRDPKPAICRSKVEELNAAHVAWRCEADARAASRSTKGSGLPIRSSKDLAKDFELPSYRFLQSMFRGLSESERTALLALGWYAKETVADWPGSHKRAVNLEPSLSERYQIGYAHHWRDGLNRWKEAPQQFQTGRWR